MFHDIASTNTTSSQVGLKTEKSVDGYRCLSFHHIYSKRVYQPWKQKQIFTEFGNNTTRCIKKVRTFEITRYYFSYVFWSKFKRI